MIKFKNLLIIIALLAMPFQLLAQSILTEFDKKVIRTDSLNLPRNTRAISLITLLPELLERPSTSIVSNYDIQIEGMSTGNAFEVALNQLLIVDIERIEVNESPISSYRNNGQGGVINFVLRSSGTTNPDFWGSAGSSITKTDEVAPQFNIGYKNKKFMVRGIMLSEFSKSQSGSETIVFNNDIFASRNSSEQDQKCHTQVLHSLMQYKISENDILRFNVSELYSYNKTLSTNNFDYQNTETQKNTKTNIQTQLRYEHNSTLGKLIAAMQYGYNPNEKSYNIPNFYEYTNDISSQNISGKLAYRLAFGNKKGMNAHLELGSNVNGIFNKETTHINDMQHSEPGNKFDLLPRTKSFYIMPYMSFDYSLAKFRLKTTFEYQHLDYEIKHSDNSFGDISNTFTGKLMAEWHFSPHKNLRLIFNRSLERPKDEQLFPYMLFSPQRRIYLEGNAELKPMMTHEVTLDYISDYNWGDGYSLILNAGASLNKISDIIHSVFPNDNISGEGGLGSALRYMSFENSGTEDIASANFMALYSHKKFSLSFTGNVYHKMQDSNDNSNHYTYFNLSLFPHFNLKDGWHGGARLVYSSRVDQNDGYLGGCAVATLTVGKAWKNFFVYLTESMPFDTRTKDVKQAGKTRTENHYQMTDNTFTTGIKYTF